MNSNISERDAEVISLYKNGTTHKDIAGMLNVSRKTVGRILAKNNVPTYTKTMSCNWCGTMFTTKYRIQKSCSDQCKSKFNKRNKGNKYKCRFCGDEYKGYKERPNCTDECRAKEREDKGTKKALIKRFIKAVDPGRHGNCKRCGNPFYKDNLLKLYCSNECYLNLTQHNFKCRECGNHFSTTHSKRMYCSKDCYKRYTNRIHDIKRRTTIQKNGNVNWDISIEKLIKRDKSLCWICNKKVDANDYHTDVEGSFIAGDYFPSIDHVLPVSKGGTHTWDNVKLSHRKCNYLKSDRIIRGNGS